MKKIKIFALPSHFSKDRTSGVDFARIIQPMEYLKLHKDFDVTLWSDIGPMLSRWDDIAPKYDIIYFNYSVNAWGFAAMGSMARKFGTSLVMDIDDGLWRILEDNPAYKVFKKDSEGIKIITSIANEVDYLTCTNGYLRNVILDSTLKNHDNIGVLPNFIDQTLYKYRVKPKVKHPIVIGHFGSTTHFTSLLNENFMKGMDKIMKNYPNVIFKTIGANIPQYKERWGARYENDFGDPDLYTWVKEKYPKVVDDVDFFVTPLVNNVYNRCKSSIKWLEVSSSKRAGVWENIRQYKDAIPEGCGILAARPEEWYNGMKTMIEDVELRNTIGKNAFKEVEDNWTIQGNIEQYADFFKKVALDNPKRT